MELAEDCWHGWVMFFPDRVVIVSQSVLLGEYFLSRFTEAIKMKARHQALHAEFSAAFSADDIRTWSAALQAWEHDPTKTNPFVDDEGGKSASQC